LDLLARDPSTAAKVGARFGMRAIFLIHLRQVIRDKDWVYPLFLLLLSTLLGQYLAPTDDDPTLVYSTRTQAIWLCAWGSSIFWVSFVAARIGSTQRQNHLRGFWKSLGVGDLGYFFSLFAIPNLLNAALFLSAALLSIFTGKQLDVPLGDWILVNLQAVFFAVLAQAVISAVILGLTNYLDASPSFACGFILNLYGMYGIEIVDLARSGGRRGAAVVSDFLWTLGPHLHFADFTSRLTFSWGALPVTPFLNISLYFFGILLLGCLIALRLWRYRSD
jgi:hypothetical protein